MSTTQELAAPYHQQDTDYYCGAACAQMVLHTVGEPLLSQDGLYNDNHSHTIEPNNWSTPPDGLQWTLNNLQSTKYFALDSADSEDTISRILCCTIEFYNVAPIALVENGNHWVVVHGYTASARPSSFGDLWPDRNGRNFWTECARSTLCSCNALTAPIVTTGSSPPLTNRRGFGRLFASTLASATTNKP
jgi:hypothetical protein